MTFRFSENGNLKEAIKNVKKLDFVGLQEEFDLSLILMKYYLQFPNLCINYKPKNVSSSSSFELEKIINDKKIFEMIIEKNKKDIELYNFVKNELFQKMKMEYPYNIEKELD